MNGLMFTFRCKVFFHWYAVNMTDLLFKFCHAALLHGYFSEGMDVMEFLETLAGHVARPSAFLSSVKGLKFIEEAAGIPANERVGGHDGLTAAAKELAREMAPAVKRQV